MRDGTARPSSGKRPGRCLPIEGVQDAKRNLGFSRESPPTATHARVAGVTWDQVVAFRLSRHFLLDRAPARALTTVVRAMAGAQAQVVSAAHLSLWARVHDLRPEDVQAAVHARVLVRAWCMRRTLHLVPSRDLAVFIRGTARRAEREIRWMCGKGVTEGELDTLIGASLDALDRPLTGRELVDHVARSLGVRVRAMRWGGWGSAAKIPGVAVGRVTVPARYLLTLAGARGVVCLGPSRGVEPTYVRADAWIPRWRDLPQKDAERRLLRWYLRAFGPATPADFARWAGMTLSDARKIWAWEETDIASVTVEGWPAAVLENDLRPLRAGGTEPSPVRLLPYFDSFLLGHEVRAHLVAARHHKRVYRTQGWIAPVVLVNGRVAGLWAHVRDGRRLRVSVTRFGALSREAVAGIRDEADRLGRFLGGPDVDVQIA